MKLKDRLLELEEELKIEEGELKRLIKEDEGRGKRWNIKSIIERKIIIEMVKSRMTESRLLYLENLKYLKDISETLADIRDQLSENVYLPVTNIINKGGKEK